VRTAILFLLLLPLLASAETIVTAEVDRDTVTVGDPILLTVTVRAPASDSAAVPLFPGGMIGPFEILESLPVEEEVKDGVRRSAARFRITAFETGSMEIPSISPAEEGTPSEAIPVTIRSVGLDPSGEPRPVKEPVPYPRGLLAYIVPAAAALLLLAIALLLIRRRRRKGEPAREERALSRPAHEIALEALRELAEHSGNGERPEREAYFRLSWIVREYLWNRYALPAPERTSREILREIKRRALSPEAKGMLRELFTRCDLVKFRGDRPERSDLIELIGRAKEFVEMTRERVRIEEERP